ncbi:unnamed protein product [Caenorhabditis auriculariae]|uniref:Uncharacterized protein n=1 Tax=Caenorhabditis auriculariae TaxID=2777116 RepID=A0A8S1H320_9PELO|nr:unnamed protein product [Caenorhabditis auriculariae]
MNKKTTFMLLGEAAAAEFKSSFWSRLEKGPDSLKDNSLPWIRQGVKAANGYLEGFLRGLKKTEFQPIGEFSFDEQDFVPPSRKSSTGLDWEDVRDNLDRKTGEVTPQEWRAFVRSLRHPKTASYQPGNNVEVSNEKRNPFQTEQQHHHQQKQHEQLEEKQNKQEHHKFNNQEQQQQGRASAFSLQKPSPNFRPTQQPQAHSGMTRSGGQNPAERPQQNRSEQIQSSPQHYHQRSQPQQSLGRSQQQHELQKQIDVPPKQHQFQGETGHQPVPTSPAARQYPAQRKPLQTQPYYEPLQYEVHRPQLYSEQAQKSPAVSRISLMESPQKQHHTGGLTSNHTTPKKKLMSQQDAPHLQTSPSIQQRSFQMQNQRGSIQQHVMHEPSAETEHKAHVRPPRPYYRYQSMENVYKKQPASPGWLESPWRERSTSPSSRKWYRTTPENSPTKEEHRRAEHVHTEWRYQEQDVKPWGRERSTSTSSRRWYRTTPENSPTQEEHRRAEHVDTGRRYQEQDVKPWGRERSTSTSSRRRYRTSPETSPTQEENRAGHVHTGRRYQEQDVKPWGRERSTSTSSRRWYRTTPENSPTQEEHRRAGNVHTGRRYQEQDVESWGGEQLRPPQRLGMDHRGMMEERSPAQSPVPHTDPGRRHPRQDARPSFGSHSTEPELRRRTSTFLSPLQSPARTSPLRDHFGASPMRSSRQSKGVPTIQKE